MGRSFVGIDIGGSYTKIAARNGRLIRVISKRLPENIVDRGVIVAPQTMSQFLKQMRREERIRARNCVIVLPPDQCFFRHVSLPAMTVKELKLNLAYEFRDYISDDPASYFYDYAVDRLIRDKNDQPKRLELYAAAVHQSMINDLDLMMRKSGFRLCGIFPPQMVIMRLFRDMEAMHPERSGHDTVIVDLGSDMIVVSLYHGANYQAHRTIDFGCREFDRVVAEARNIDVYTAASYVADNFESVLDTPECYAVCDRICVEINKVVNFYNFSNRDKDINHMYIMGGGAQIPQLVASLVSAIDVPVESAAELTGFGELNTDSPNGFGGLMPQYVLAYACMREGEAM